jgi:hypothetical protein
MRVLHTRHVPFNLQNPETEAHGEDLKLRCAKQCNSAPGEKFYGA